MRKERERRKRWGKDRKEEEVRHRGREGRDEKRQEAVP